MPVSTISTTSSEHILDGKINQEDGDSFDYVVGAILFSLVAVCVFVSICLHMIWSTKFRPVKPSSDIDTPAKKEPTSTSNATVARAKFVDEVVDCENLDHQEDSVDHPPSHKMSDSHVRCDAVLDGGRKPVAFGIPCAQPFSRERKPSKQSPSGDHASLQEEPCPDDGASESWVGSPEWAAARASRKKRLSEIFKTSIITGIPIKQPVVEGDARRPVIETETPLAPLAPPPKLEVLLPCANIEDADCIMGVAEANAGVFEQLQHTASDDIALRKKQFKTLCARWHPDKHLQENVEFTTEVFQYLQAQKTWYLD